MHIDQRMEPKDRASWACCWSTEGIQSVRFMHGDWIKHDASLTPSAIQQHRAFISSPSSWSCIWFFFFHIRVFQGLITQSKISGFIVVIESSKVVSIIISQQGINRNKKGKALRANLPVSSLVTHNICIWRLHCFHLAQVFLELSAHLQFPCKYSCLLWAIVLAAGLRHWPQSNSN